MINLSLYPIEDLSTPAAQALIAYCRDQMKTRGACELKDFVTPETVALLAAEAKELEPQAFFNAMVGNAYLDIPGPEFGPDHPRAMTEPTRLGAIAYDQIPLNSLLAKIYENDTFMNFVGAVLELEKIYRYDDPLSGLNIAVMKEGDYLRWHYDQTDFVSSLAIQSAEEGGDFEFVPMVRNANDECYDEVKKVLTGSRERVEFLKNRPGTLAIFKGRYSLHRVTPIKGPRPRYIGLFGFDSQPGVSGTDHLRKIRYGRTHVMERK